jgi:uncharacterized protein YukE
VPIAKSISATLQRYGDVHCRSSAARLRICAQVRELGAPQRIIHLVIPRKWGDRGGSAAPKKKRKRPMESKQGDQARRLPRTQKTDESSLSADVDHLAETASSIKQEAEAAIETVKQTVVETSEREKNYAADRMGAVAKAVHGAADELGSQLPEASGYIHEAAAGLERASSSLHESSVQDILAAFNKLAREQPALFFGGAVLAGISLSRFLKSSAQEHRR